MTAEKITNTWRSKLYNLPILSGGKTRENQQEMGLIWIPECKAFFIYIYYCFLETLYVFGCQRQTGLFGFFYFNFCLFLQVFSQSSFLFFLYFSRRAKQMCAVNNTSCRFLRSDAGKGEKKKKSCRVHDAAVYVA